MRAARGECFLASISSLLRQTYSTMSGLEVAGLSIAIFSVACKAVSHYRGRLRTKDVEELASSLDIHSLIFTNSIRHLLSAALPDSEVEALIKDSKGPAWKEQSLRERVIKNLGEDADRLLQLIETIKKTISALEVKLSKIEKEDDKMSKRASRVIKSFLHGKGLKDHNPSMTLLKARVTEFRTLAQDAVILASSRTQTPLPEPELPPDLYHVHDCANSLYDAVRACWTCGCSDSHPIHMQLEIWSIPASGNDDTACLAFALLFADSAEKAEDCNWMTAEIAISQASPGTHPSTPGSPSSPSGSVHRLLHPQTM